MQATSDEIIINNVYTSLNDNNLRLGGASPERENNNVISPNAWYDLSIKWSVTKFVKQTDTPLQAKQIATVPAGGTKKISTKYTTKSSFTVSGSAKEKGLTAAVESNLTGDLTYTIEKTYTGPSIDSGYVSYVFWLTPFVNRGTWTAKGTGVPSGDEYGPYNGSYEEPTKFVEWTQPIK
ncbi:MULTISPECIES: hypothetical protein [Ureibacillus]|nr:hypothetical protein [Ureibacillus thermosphaericus]